MRTQIKGNLYKRDINVWINVDKFVNLQRIVYNDLKTLIAYTQSIYTSVTVTDY